MAYINEVQGELKPENNDETAYTFISCSFGLLFMAIGLVNTFWGNDPGFGVFIIVLALAYFLPVNTILQKLTGFTFPHFWLVKIFLGLFILWASLGVGELFDKIELMQNCIQ